MLKGDGEADWAFVGLISVVLLTLIWLVLENRRPADSYAAQRCAALKLVSRGSEAGESRAAVGEPDWCDLAAQESMAKSTLGMDWSARFSVVLAYLGLLLLWGTLHYTRKVAEGTSETLKLAREANQTAREANDSMLRVGKAQTRAYVVPDAVVATLKHQHIALEFELFNSGNSPALEVEVSPVAVMSVGKRPAQPLSMNSPGVTIVVSAMPNGFKQKRQIELIDCTITEEEAASLATKNRLFINAILRVSYTDVFGDRQKAQFEYIGTMPRAYDGCHVKLAAKHNFHLEDWL